MRRCPKCGSKSKVTDVRDGKDGAARRERRCTNLKCGKKWSTIEFTARKVVAYVPEDRRPTS